MNIPDVNEVYQAVADLITEQNEAGQKVYEFMEEHYDYDGNEKYD